MSKSKGVKKAEVRRGKGVIQKGINYGGEFIYDGVGKEVVRDLTMKGLLRQLIDKGQEVISGRAEVCGMGRIRLESVRIDLLTMIVIELVDRYYSKEGGEG